MARRKKAAPKRKSKWTPDNILSDPKSPLASADLRSVLANPLAWTSLSIQERRDVLCLFPDMAHTLDADTDDARPNFETLMNDDSFRYDCAAYVDNLAMGRHDAVWLEDAWSAHDRRKAGEFDEWLRDKFVEDWAVEPPDDSKKAKPEERRVQDGQGEGVDGQKRGDETESTLAGCQPQDEADNGDSNHCMGEDSHRIAIL
ncbi:uncharacterized protein G6M90_00g020790 [Metarhizium brunneum]|uniref:ASX DEUBAD domain-containing protein n=1 Tax=Metarhizium brunneum TaxID=500148 RepID=A0A7D5UPV1_9HYPO|nr:hypothetical protein G6M90_00g020790 [Metarhizium brunneum]